MMSDSVNPYEATTVAASEPIVAQGDYATLSGTAIGLKIIYFGIVLALLCLIGIFAAVAALPAAIIPITILFLIAYLLLTVGPFFCLTAPEETGARGLIIGSIACQILVLLESVLSFLGIALPPLISPLVSVLSLLGAALFILFMMKIASYIQRDDLRQSGRTILIGSIILFVLLVVGTLGVFVVGAIAGLISMCAGIMAIVLFVMYANLVNRLYQAIKSLQTGTHQPAV